MGKKAAGQEDGKLIFNLDLTTKASLGEGFRVFAPCGAYLSGDRNYNREGQKDPVITIIYTDGSCIRNDEGHAAAGAGI